MAETLEKITILLPKSDSYFLYFLLEAHEGIAFYSTTNVPNTPKGLVTIECYFHPSTSHLVEHLLRELKNQQLISYSLIS